MSVLSSFVCAADIFVSTSSRLEMGENAQHVDTSPRTLIPIQLMLDPRKDPLGPSNTWPFPTILLC